MVLLLARSTYERSSYVLPLIFFNFTSLISEMRQRKQGKLLWMYVFRCKFHRQVLVFGEPTPIFLGGKKIASLQWGLWIFLYKANLRDA